jgi:endonuclease III-like uncharacterized protein
MASFFICGIVLLQNGKIYRIRSAYRNFQEKHALNPEKLRRAANTSGLRASLLGHRGYTALKTGNSAL